MNESEYRTIAHVHSQERIRGAVWRLVRRGVQDALYELSDALKATVMGKAGTLRRASWEWVSGKQRNVSGRFSTRFFLENQQKVLYSCEIS